MNGIEILVAGGFAIMVVGMLAMIGFCISLLVFWPELSSIFKKPKNKLIHHGDSKKNKNL